MAKTLTVIVCLFVTCSCANTEAVKNTSPVQLPEVPIEDSRVQVIVADLVNILVQIPGYETSSTTIQISEPNAPFGVSLLRKLKSVGYGIQKVAADQGINYISYNKSVIRSESGVVEEYKINIRDLQVSRQYIKNNGHHIPASPLIISGVPTTSVQLSDDTFFKPTGTHSYPTGVRFLDSIGNIENTTESMFVVNTPVSESTNQSNEYRDDSTRNELPLIQSGAGTNQYLDDYKAISQVVIKFPTNDVKYLGVNNKYAIALMAKQGNTNQHRFTIRGCSRKNIMWPEEDELLSLKRQDRVSRELQATGVKPGLIKEENCSIESDQGDLPKQSVVLTLHKAR